METLQESSLSLSRTDVDSETEAHIFENLSERMSHGESVSAAPSSINAHKAHSTFGLNSTEAALLYQDSTAIQNRFARRLPKINFALTKD